MRRHYKHKVKPFNGFGAVDKHSRTVVLGLVELAWLRGMCTSTWQALPGGDISQAPVYHQLQRAKRLASGILQKLADADPERFDDAEE